MFVILIFYIPYPIFQSHIIRAIRLIRENSWYSFFLLSRRSLFLSRRSLFLSRRSLLKRTPAIYQIPIKNLFCHIKYPFIPIFPITHNSCNSPDLIHSVGTRHGVSTQPPLLFLSRRILFLSRRILFLSRRSLLKRTPAIYQISIKNLFCHLKYPFNSYFSNHT